MGSAQRFVESHREANRRAGQHDIPVAEADFSLADVYGADEAFVTGTFAGVIPVIDVDGRTLSDGRRGPLTKRLQDLYAALVDAQTAGG